MYKHIAIFQGLKRRPAFDLDCQVEVRFHFLKDSKGCIGDWWMRKTQEPSCCSPDASRAEILLETPRAAELNGSEKVLQCGYK